MAIKSFPLRAYTVLPQVSLSYSVPLGRFPRVTHPSATPVLLRAFDLHVLGLPPAFVLSQDQTLKLKVSILVGLEVTPRNLCVTGTFTQSASIPVARTGCAVVMAETQRSPESRRPAGHLRARTDPPGLRRLRFSFFNPLVKERRGSGHDRGPVGTGPSWQKRSTSPRSSQEELRFNPEIACPLSRINT